MPSIKDIQMWEYYQNENAAKIVKTDTFTPFLI